MAADKKSRKGGRRVTRNGYDRQPDLFAPMVAGDRSPAPTGTPAWSELPAEARGTLTRLMARLILEHISHLGGGAQREAGHDL